MKTNKCKFGLALSLLIFVQLLLADSLLAQSERFLWEIHSPDIYIVQKEIDSVGNVYVGGTFGSQDMLAGQLICPADTNAWLMGSRGVFIAKFDTAGTMQWCRSVKDWREGNGVFTGFYIRDSKISFVFSYYCKYLLLPWDPYQQNKHCWLHFIDTTYYGMIDGVVQPYGTLPYRYGTYYYLVSLDLDGNRLDTKIANYLYGKYCQDSKGNHFFLVNEDSDSSGRCPYIQLNDDTTQRFYFPSDNSYVYPPAFAQKQTPYLIKINSDWTNVTITQLTDSLNGYRNVQGDSVFSVEYYDGYNFCSFEIDNQDVFYISGFIYPDRFNTSRPLELKFNSGATLWYDSGFAGCSQNYILSVDTMGYVRWAQGFYYENFPDSERGDFRSYNDMNGGVFVDSDYVYYIGSFFSQTRWEAELYVPEYVPMLNVFFDRNHQDTLLFPNPRQWYVASIVQYDKRTGEYISHISLGADSVGTRSGRGARPYVSEDYIMTNASNTYINNCTYRYNRHTNCMEVYDTIFSSGLVGNKGVLVSDNGFVEKWISGGSLQSSNFYIPANNSTCVSIIYYYDSLLDRRRREMPPEDSTAVEGVGEINIKVFPNPTSDIVNIVVSEPIRQIMLYDVDGRIVKSIKIGASTSTSIDIGDCPQGVYILKISTMSGESVGKIIRI